MASCKNHRPPKEQETVERSWLHTSLAQQIFFKSVLMCAQHKAGKVVWFFFYSSACGHSASPDLPAGIVLENEESCPVAEDSSPSGLHAS